MPEFCMLFARKKYFSQILGDKCPFAPFLLRLWCRNLTKSLMTENRKKKAKCVSQFSALFFFSEKKSTCMGHVGEKILKNSCKKYRVS